MRAPALAFASLLLSLGAKDAGGSSGGGGGGPGGGSEPARPEATRITERLVALPHHLPPMDALKMPGGKLSTSPLAKKSKDVPWDPFGKPKLF